MIEKQLREQRSRLRSEKIYHARIIGDVFPNIESVEIRASVLFESGVGDGVEKEYRIVLGSKDKLYVYVPCLNNDCTGYGFDLTDIVKESVRKKENDFGKVECDGKEDWKYCGSSGYTCQSTLNYAVFPQYISEVGND